jgi:hypothetical protein
MSRWIVEDREFRDIPLVIAILYLKPQAVIMFRSGVEFRSLRKGAVSWVPLEPSDISIYRGKDGGGWVRHMSR